MYFNKQSRKCKVRPETVKVSIDESLLSPFRIKTSKSSGSCNSINDPHAKLCVLDVVKT